MATTWKCHPAETLSNPTVKSNVGLKKINLSIKSEQTTPIKSHLRLNVKNKNNVKKLLENCKEKETATSS